MLASRRRQQRRLLNTSNFGAHAYRLLIAAALTLAVSALVLLVDATGAVPAPQVYSRPGPGNPSPTATSPASATPTNTVPATPPSISLMSPSSDQGPVGAHVTIQGSNFTGSSPSIFASLQPDCSQSSGALPVSATISGGSFTTTFVWPSSFHVGIYYICAAGMSGSNAVYQVLSTSPPALSLSTLSVEIGQPLTIQGSNFVGLPAGASISFTEVSGGQQPVLLQVNPPVVDSTGSFSVTWTVQQGLTTGTATIKASAGAEGSSPAVLQASAAVTIQAAATVTATVAVSPTVGQGENIHNQSSNGSIILIILLITGILIAMAVIVGIVIFLTMRRRGPQAGEWQKPGYSDYGGYGSYADSTVQSSSQYPPETDTFGWPRAGGQVSQWDDADSQPGPDWQPRPMSGYYPSYNDPTQSSTSYRQRSQPESPIDPWDDSPPPTRYGTYPGQNPRHRGEAGAANPDDDQWPDLDNNGGSRGW